ncbi:head-tail adaptor protein [Xanthomonas maliensis]|nr:head-tail adaptor protein [Xanthomonas maliensis]
MQRPATGTDPEGQPAMGWEDAGQLWAGIANETGMGAIRSSVAAGLPTSIARYSFLVRFADAAALGVDAGMRIAHDGLVFEIKGVIRDLKDRDRAYLVTEQGGNSG